MSEEKEKKVSMDDYKCPICNKVYDFKQGFFGDLYEYCFDCGRWANE
tara:strand:- start:487 stop:627 length:141 start_codon:yes stop_codon:yes gene_type:complete